MLFQLLITLGQLNYIIIKTQNLTKKRFKLNYVINILIRNLPTY